MYLAKIVCEEPEILKIMIVIKTIMTLLQICVPIGLILSISKDVLKAVTRGKQEEIMSAVGMVPKRLVVAAIVYFVPLLINIVTTAVDDKFEYANCFSNANVEFISEAYKSKAEGLLVKAEEMIEDSYIAEAMTAINKIEDETLRNAMTARANAVASQVDEKEKEFWEENAVGPSLTLNEQGYESPDDSQNVNLNGTGSVDFTGTYTDGKATTDGKGSNSSEPDPSAAINYWIEHSDLYNEGDFVYPDDNGKSRGAWPKDFKNIPSQLTGCKTYGGGAFIFPNTPYKNELLKNEGIYNFVYHHRGIDVVAPIGIPVYSPVNGKLNYSTWGHTKNKGTRETSYTVTIDMTTPTNVDEVTIGTVFLTHLSGIIYRCEPGECNQEIKQGQLVGYTGWAEVGHLHMSMYPTGSYYSGIHTEEIEALYGIPIHTQHYNIKAGG